VKKKTPFEEAMQNVTLKVEGNKLIIDVDLSKEIGPSSSGKTTLIASSEATRTCRGTTA
jgi:ABC-type polar amino acid transport system ATPase subunit